tara:strand:- start:19050 stop:19328 length:279 start_codon:yes stop_codon:yes gene_type:complete
MNKYSDVTLTTQAYNAVKNSNTKWNKDHIKAFFRSRINKPLDDAASIGVLNRVSILEGISMEVINGKKHVFTSSSTLSKKLLANFLYGRPVN